MKRRVIYAASAATILIISPLSILAVTPGQVDDFQDGTTQGWTDGVGGNTTNISAGGPGGSSDSYLQLSSGEFGGQGRFITFNQSQWTGDYVTPGITAITMDLKLLNIDPSQGTLPIRITLRDQTGGQATPGYSSTTAFDLPNDGNWHEATFSLSDMTAVSPFGLPVDSLETVLSSVQDFRLLSASAPSIIGASINAQIGIDNITAVVPAITLTWNGQADATTWDKITANWNDGINPASTFADGATVTFDDTASPSTTAISLDTAVSPKAVIVDSTTNQYTIAGAGTMTGNGSLTKRGSSTLTITANISYTGGTNVEAGTLIVSNKLAPGTLNISGGVVKVAAKPTNDDPAGVSIIPALSITGTGRLDLTNNGMIVDYTDNSPLTDIKSALHTGYANGAWTGPGIISSSAAASHRTAIGYAEASALGITDTGTFLNQTVDSTAILMRYTYAGDADLNGMVNMSDFNLLAANFGASGTVWTEGDFNYDGIVNLLDLNDIATNFGASISRSLSLGTLVPEPGHLFAIAALLLITKREKPARNENANSIV